LFHYLLNCLDCEATGATTEKVFHPLNEASLILDDEVVQFFSNFLMENPQGSLEQCLHRQDIKCSEYRFDGKTILVTPKLKQ